MPDPFAPFLDPAALRINKARLDHLVGLGLDLAGKRVLEVGAGIGLHTEFFAERGCDVLSTDANPANVAEMLRRHPQRKLGILDLDRAAPLGDLGVFDIVYCYGTLYHLGDPDGALARLAAICEGQILVETIVSRGNYSELHFVPEPSIANQGVYGIGTRPTRQWVMAALRRHFVFAYTTLDQPDYPEFPVDWNSCGYSGNLRAIFVGSKTPLLSPNLTLVPPDRHRNAPTAKPEAPANRVWIDVGAFEGPIGREAVLQDPSLTIHAFEPLPHMHDRLQREQPANFKVHAMAVSERDGMATFHINRYTGASSLLSMDEAARAEWIDGDLLVEERDIIVPTVRLDTFMAQHRIAEVEFLKIDAQGADFSVVRSLGARLRDVHCIKLEVAITARQLYCGAAEKSTIVEFMAAANFELTGVERQSHDQEENLIFTRRS